MPSVYRDDRLTQWECPGRYSRDDDQEVCALKRHLAAYRVEHHDHEHKRHERRLSRNSGFLARLIPESPRRPLSLRPVNGLCHLCAKASWTRKKAFQ